MKRKIFVDGRAFDKYFEGTRTYVENLYKIIDHIGDLEIYIGSETNNAEFVFAGSKNIRFIKYDQTSSKLKRILVEIPEIISKYKIDASHFQYVVSPLKKNLQIVTIHDILFKDYPAYFGLKYRLTKGFTFYLSAKKADIVTTVSEYSKKALTKHFKINEADIHVIPNGVASNYFDDYDNTLAIKSVTKKYGVGDFILYVSRIEPRKNQLDLIRAYIELKLYDKNIDLVLIGKKDIPVVELELLINNDSEKIRKHIFFLSNIDNDDLKLFYQAARIFVYPSKAEGFGIPPLEAAAFKTPTICSNTTAMEEFNFFGANHIHPDIANIKTALSNLINNPISYIELNRIQSVIRSKYSWEKSAIKLNNLILEKLS